MPVYQIPPDARQFEIVKSKSGEYMVVSETTGQAGVAIPVHSEEQAHEVCDRLNRGQHDGTIDVPLAMP
ncbi:MAG TPA: hypothetical protein VHP11_05400 [Tepidisphaeraceae bacterium]|nr:hypothetical protein [Tepidisphaeraceae bacterium]